MKILKQDRAGNQVTLEIEEEYSAISSKMEKAYKEVSLGVKIPGFRQGKIPTDVLKKYINEAAVIDRAVQILVSDIYPGIIDTAKIKPVDYPNVDVKQLKNNEPIILSIKVEVYPKIKLANYKGIELKQGSGSVEDSEVDNTIGFIRKNFADANNLKEADVALDDDFAKKVSRMNTIAELKDIIRSNIAEEKKRESEMSMKDEVTKKLADLVEADVPAKMIDRELDAMLNDLEISLKRNRMTLKSYLSAVKKDIEKLKEEMNPNALVRVKAKLALEEISEKEDIKVDDADLDKELELMAKQSQNSLEDYKKDLSQDIIETIKDYMLREKTMDFVISKAKII